MAYAREIMQGGLSAGTSKSIGGQVKTAISAAGTTSADATTVTASINVLGTVGSGSGVIISDGELGDSVIVYNGGLNGVKVYPPSGDTFNQGLASFTLPINTACQINKITTAIWVVFVSA